MSKKDDKEVFEALRVMRRLLIKEGVNVTRRVDFIIGLSTGKIAALHEKSIKI